jgi:hypothetical protein
MTDIMRRSFCLGFDMAYKIELRYLSGWGDAEWTIDDGNGEVPLRFPTVESAQDALEEFFAAVKVAVAEGDMDIEEARSDYRIVEALD